MPCPPQCEVGSTLVYRDTDGAEWYVPVFTEKGLPHVHRPELAYEEFIESYRRGLAFAQSREQVTDEEASDDEAHEDEDEVVPSMAKKGLGPVRYELRARAEEMHIILEHVRSLHTLYLDSWYRKDLPELLRALKGKPMGDFYARELWGVVSQKRGLFDPEDTPEAANAKRKAVNLARPMIEKTLGGEPTDE